MSKKTYYTITEAAKALKITRSAIHLAIKEKRIKAKQGVIVVVKKTVAWMIDPKSLAAYRAVSRRKKLVK